MTHRGPDDERTIRGGTWGLGFCRLAILDLSLSGAQPMMSRDGDGWIVFNGEIYNFAELRAELRSDGYGFRSSGDAEVLLNWLHRHGRSGISRLNGMYSFAYLDLRKRTLLLARDRAGQKPLYYLADGKRIVFGSELKSIVRLSGIRPTIDRVAVNQYFAFNYVPAPRSIFEEVRKLEPAHFIEFSLELPRVTASGRYWDLDFGKQTRRSKADYRNEVDELLRDSVSRRLVSDVPVGTFLSGGLDSSLVTALASDACGGDGIAAFTIGFDESDWDESKVAQAVADHTGARHTVEMLQPRAIEVLDDLVWHYEEPFADSSAVPTFYLCQAASKHGKVFLSGDGGDEIFAGYGRYATARRFAWLDRLPSFVWGRLSTLIGEIAPDHGTFYSRAMRLLRPNWERAASVTVFPEDPLCGLPLREEWRMQPEAVAGFIYQAARDASHLDPISRLQYLDYRFYLSNDILVKLDRASMAHSIEVRSPFLDHRLAELAATIPPEAHFDGQQGKRILRAIAHNYLPQTALNHRKQGFGVPFPKWFQGEALSRIERDFFDHPRTSQREFYELSAIRRLFRWQKSGESRDMSHVIWRLIFFEHWCRQFIDVDPAEWSRKSTSSPELSLRQP